MASTDPQLRRLARQLTGFDKRLHDLETVPQLAHSSIDDGTLPVYDKDGNLAVAVGRQPDGTWGAPPLAGPTPSAPIGVSATGGAGIVHIRWTGDYFHGAAPLDFDALEVLIDDQLAGAIPNRDGGSITIEADQGAHFISARIRTLVPRHSSATSPFLVEVGPPADQLFLDARAAIEAAEGDIEAAKQAIADERAAREAALADAQAALDDLDDRLNAAPDDAALQAIRDDLAIARDEAAAATTAAGEAQTAADTANANALAAAGIAADKGRIIYAPEKPTDPDDQSTSNLWIDSDTGRVYVWDETAGDWIESENESLRDAAQAAAAALQAAEAADAKAGDAADAAAAAQAAAVAAQATADEATIDAREAHNVAVGAQAVADDALEKYGPLDQRTVDAQVAADAAQARAEEAFALADGKPDMADVEVAIETSANGKNAITVSSAAPTASTPGVVTGDTWWRVDGDGVIFAQYRWTGSAWSPVTVRSEVIASLDVGKLVVTGSSRFTEAVVDRLFADLFVAHKITAEQITIAALDENGELAPGSVGAITLQDGIVGADKIIADEVAAEVSNLVRANVEKLTVTDGATINEAVILKIAAEMITSGVLRTADSGQRVVIDSSGLVMFGLDADGIDYEMVRIGPSGDNLITLGDTTVSASGIQAPSGEFGTLSVDGQDLLEIIRPYGQGVTAFAHAGYNSAWHGMNLDLRRLEAVATLQPNRRYRITVDQHYVQLRSASPMTYVEMLRSTIDGVYSDIAESRWTLSGTTEQTVGSLVGWATGSSYTQPSEARFGLVVRGPSGRDHRIVASSAAPLRITVEDVGSTLVRTGNSYMDEGTPAEGTASAPPKETPTKRYTKTYSSTGYRTYDNNGSQTSDPDVVQGLYAGGPSSRLRKGGWTFPSMTGDLAGATIEKIQVKLYLNHSYYTAGATVNVCTWGGVMRDNLTVQRTLTSWKRNTPKWIPLSSSTFAGFKSGAIAGIGVKPTNSFAEQYARFATSAKIEITFTK
ncbi:hypothetical protein ACTXJ9_11170 [Brachybacterium tyrofermentans]|uniref:hypothetical protein n=1 Tax=Brachybacterium tyrofermentans TaxID=47848 RepID=UPI003FD0F65C